ncbi:sn-glycerol-3-phosphate ABC transporter substrate-binding protein UgpB [Undibacterium sp. 5I1]|uniref:sn-glycerol-3-phosphate ABC transporter substrate-binding protein UgpB n=1 Tax=unclassified Undibacterium TaxID=2630295 RepID=UPI002AB4CBFF|nr:MULTISPECIES: sn-glycerol-3-phosphate ABC transporter substrate-binding protein UgpB [unclassified Undibacterium]MDY7538865.1 sn-glycerol-3-phosphate ABC transporter substrate-binding protein UgpB [Undibacterium sp. 5I1]MEB0230991.1 sn-glycerol-3-phosphate ABC transporter substrate-binding protein UgpB [Undibacterium sp. 10I3]MEB0257826.1 sn-glycerol-3-phosphate ABC transporter substrate-binding protein UgpB [Undibacterium sp. 5I1]
MKIKFTSIVLAMLAMGTISNSAHALTEISWWHSMTGALGDRVNALSEQFNKSQSDYKVVPVYKGSYDEAMAAAIAAYRAGNAPNILQVFEVGTATMMYSKGAIKPVTEVMKLAGEQFDSSVYIPAVAGYYTTPKGEMVSFPFNSSTTVFYYNKDMFAKAGMDPNKAPATWQEVVAAAARLKANGEKCGFTTGWQTWVHLESFSAWHNVEFASKGNGFGGLDARLKFNGPLQVKHIENMANWAKQGYFTYAGRKNEPEAKFYSGECGMLTSSSSAYGNVVKNAKFKFAVAPLPYYSDAAGAPQNTIIGGASLWTMSGKKIDEYKAVAKFYKFLSQPEVQAKWHQETGYLPITNAAYELTKKSGFYDKNPGPNIAVQQMIVKTTDKSRGIRLGNFVQIRTIMDEELESVWSGKKTAKEALDNAVARGNELLERFEKANK